MAQKPARGGETPRQRIRIPRLRNFFRDASPFPIPHSQFPKTQSQPIKSGVWRFFRLTRRPSGQKKFLKFPAPSESKRTSPRGGSGGFDPTIDNIQSLQMVNARESCVYFWRWRLKNWGTSHTPKIIFGIILCARESNSHMR